MEGGGGGGRAVETNKKILGCHFLIFFPENKFDIFCKLPPYERQFS